MITDSLARIRDALPLRRIDRYLMRHFLVSWAVCTIAIFGLFMVIEGLSRIDRFLKQDESLIIVLVRYFGAVIPIYFAQFLGPVLTLLAAMFAVTQLNKGNELVPLRLAGLSTGRILAPFFLIALLMAGGMVFLQEAVIPNLKDLIRTATAYGKTKNSIRPEVLSDSFNKLIHVKEYVPDQKRGTFPNIQVRHTTNLSLASLIQAEEIIWIEPEGGDPYWLLTNGTIQRWDDSGKLERNPDATGEDVFLQHFREYKLKTDMQPVDLESSDREINYLSFGELRDQYKRRSHLTHLEVKLHQRFAFPLANFILLLLGIPFVMRGENKSVIIGIAYAIGIAAGYLLATMICADLGNKELLPPILAAWLPVLFFGALGLTLFDSIDG